MVLSQMVKVEEVISASDADFLAGSALDQPGVPGVYTIWTASTVGDSTISVSQGGRVLSDQSTIVLRANSEIRMDQDDMIQVLSQTGGRPVIAIVEVTSALIRVRVIFIPAFAT